MSQPHSAADGYVLAHLYFAMAEQWENALPRLPAEQVAIAIRIFETTPELCIDQTGLPFPTLASWLAYCDWACAEYGAYPDGT